ncbi:MAG TPA: nuclear transport factor 2 family protein [Steroidobacteraceae bacterium]|nr:nuclear transport factor 2 family protein [Steroidobacteraceae bacterium]
MITAIARTAAFAAALSILVTACTHSMSTPSIPGTRELEARVAALEARKSLLEDTNAVERLQRAYGYYLDRGLWDEAANLFAADATLEVGLDGVYVGQKRVREYLRAVGGGRTGLAPGQLFENMQLMPYVSISSDGRTAKATWRDVILSGQLGNRATWGEGPYVNQYVKDHGVWKIKSLHWYQTLVVPYHGGWAKNIDVNGGKYVSDQLPPDRPPTEQYRTWPGGYLPPFTFDQPENGASAPVSERSTADHEASLQDLAHRVAVLRQDVQLLRDQDDIENLQRIYGYYIDKAMWTQAADLFADDGEYEIDGRGTFIGKKRVLSYLRGIGTEFPQAGRLYDQMQLQPIVHVAPDGKSARGRWRIFSQAAQAGKFHEWGVGIAENDYVKDHGVWKIRKVHYFPTMYTPFEDGWGKTVRMTSSFEPSLTPDRTAASARQSIDGISVPPFHYPNPVTGAPVYTHSAADFAVALPAASTSAIEKALAEVDHRLGLLEDFQQLENLQMRYGYYLATLEWDRLANLFAADGNIEIALRGAYVGRASIRRSLNLYGEPGVHEGNLHNHMQFQPVIDVADDGKTARVRARAFSMMGNYGKAGMWMGGIYENQFVKVNGVWQFHHDQVYNTYFIPYDQGWKDLQPRPPPGVSTSNPPDRPPSVHFEMYPRPTTMPPFHYNNPVTGKPTPIPQPPP